MQYNPALIGTSVHLGGHTVGTRYQGSEYCIK